MNNSKLVYNIYKFLLLLKKANIPFLPNLLNKILLRVFFGFQIGLGAQIGKNVSFGYGGLGVVIHSRVIIDDFVQIGSNVTIGGTTKKRDVPIIGKNSMISTGAKILGPIKIGKNCVIGANAVVLSDVPDNSVAVGVPAKIIKSNINIRDYRDID